MHFKFVNAIASYAQTLNLPKDHEHSAFRFHQDMFASGIERILAVSSSRLSVSASHADAFASKDRAQGVDNILPDASPRDRAVRLGSRARRLRHPMVALTDDWPTPNGDAQAAAHRCPRSVQGTYTKHADDSNEAADSAPWWVRGVPGVPCTACPCVPRWVRCIQRSAVGRARTRACAREQEGYADVQLSVVWLRRSRIDSEFRIVID